MTSEQHDPLPSAVERTGSDWRRPAGLLGAAFASAAAVLLVWLAFAPQATSYAASRSWVAVALIAVILLLAGAGVVFAAWLPLSRRRPSPAQSEQRDAPPAPQAFPDGSFPDGSFPDGSFPDGSFPDGTFPDGTPPKPMAASSPTTPGAAPGPAPRAGDDADPAAAGRGLTILGALIGAAGLALGVVAVALAALLPTPTESVQVQFTDLYGRVQLEYCPTLPASFPATASRDDLAGSSTILPVRISAETCGNADYVDGIWLYLNRPSITVSDLP